MKRRGATSANIAAQKDRSHTDMDSRHGQGQGHDGGDSTQSTADLTAFVQNLLQQMQSRFQTMSDSIISKNILFHQASGQLVFDPCLFALLDEMGSRIDDLEKSIGELVKEAGVDSPPSPPTSGQGQLPPK
ncbi:unnamed protein product [Sphagnum compactum]